MELINPVVGAGVTTFVVPGNGGGVFVPAVVGLVGLVVVKLYTPAARAAMAEGYIVPSGP